VTLATFTFTDRVRPFVELGVGDSRTDIGVGRWDQSHWDNATDATWAGTEPLWLDVTCDSHSVETSIGRQRVTDAFAPGTATLTLANTSGWADPQPPSDDLTLMSVRPGRAIRVGVDHDTLGRRVLFRGFVDRSEPRYDPTFTDVVDLSCIDALGEVGRVQLAAVADPGVGAGENAGSRIHRYLNAAKWPVAKRSIVGTGVTMSATTFGQQVADLLTQCADSAGGACFGDETARIVFRGRDWQTYEPSDPVDGTLGNIAAGDACPNGWVLSSDRRDIITQVVLARESDAVPFPPWDDSAGQSLYGVETFERTDLICESATQLDTLAARILRTRGWQVTPRVERVDLDAATSDIVLDVMASATPYEPSRYRCRLALARGVIFDAELFVTGVRHTIAPEAWFCQLDLDLAAPYVTKAGYWDGDDWDQATWAGPTRTLEAV
jgi:hypothetical protein